MDGIEVMLCSSFCSHYFIQYIEVGVVINEYHHHPKGEGGGVFIKEFHDSHRGCAGNEGNGFTICINTNRKLQPDSNVLRIHILHVMKGSLHDGMVTVDVDKYRLVEILPSGREPPDVGLTRIL